MNAHRLKLERARKHVKDLADEIAAFHASQPYRIVVENDDSNKRRVWRLRVSRTMPIEWSGIVGDAIHNARSALDLLAVALVQKGNPTLSSLDHVHFVIATTEQVFNRRIREELKGASANALSLLRSLKPYKGGNDDLWLLHKLDQLDKHRAIIPVGAAHGSVGIIHDFGKIFPDLFKNGEKVPKPTISLKPADRQFPLRDGAILFADSSQGQAFFADDDIKFRFDVAFGDGQIVDGELLLPTIERLLGIVDHALTMFEAHILSSN